MPDTRILILSSAEVPLRQELNNEFVRGINEKLGEAGQVEWYNYQHIGFEFGTKFIRAFITDNNVELNRFRFVYFKSYFRHSEQAAAIAEYLDAHDVPFMSSELREYMPLSKLTQQARMARAGLPIPYTLFMSTEQFKQAYQKICDTMGSPFIFKTIDGASGHDNFLVSTQAQFHTILDENPELLFIAQKFISNSSDLRILIVNNKIELIIKRQRQDDSTHLNNTSQGAGATLVPVAQLDPAYQELALQAARIMKREVAGVDLMFEEGSGYPYILEVNASPQVASGAFRSEKLEIYSNLFVNMLKYK